MAVTKVKAKKADKKAEKKAEKAKKRANKKPMPKFLRIITAPFRGIGRYLKNSWIELRQVRWPNRKATWKMVLAVFVYTILLVTIITLLDVFFTWIFNLILG